jgi:hypothetical protein
MHYFCCPVEGEYMIAILSIQQSYGFYMLPVYDIDMLWCVYTVINHYFDCFWVPQCHVFPIIYILQIWPCVYLWNCYVYYSIIL